MIFSPQRKSKWQAPSKPHGLRAFRAGSVAPTIEMSRWAGSLSLVPTAGGRQQGEMGG